MSPGGVKPDLRDRFREVVRDRGLFADGDAVVVAVSGGLDSVALLHLLRFTPRLPRWRLVSAHFDHAMRQGSGRDAEWVRGICGAWRVEARFARAADEALRSEDEARSARYAYLEQTRRDVGARCVLTAHTADDQAETVLHRVVRGTGLAGLAGIREYREPGVWRPLLDFWRADLEAYTAAAHLSWRDDPTNADLGFARNALRHAVLPVLERSVSPGARRALVRLAEHAREDEAAWSSVLPRLLEGLGLELTEGSATLPRDALLELSPPLRARLLRDVARRLGKRLDHAGTRTATDFAAAGASGRRVELGADLELRRDFDRLVLVVGGRPAGDRVASIPAADVGEDVALIGGRRYRVAWGGEPAAGFESATFPLGRLSFPLTVRSWRAGDRIRMPYGTKKLKKLFGEARIPAARRGELPVLVDAEDAVLWVPGVARSAAAAEEPEADLFRVGIADGGTD